MSEEQVERPVLDAVLELSQDALFVLDLGDQTAIWNRATYRLFGLDPVSFVPTLETIYPRTHPEDRQRHEQALVDHLERGQPYDLELRWQHEDGHYLWLRETGEAVRDADGKPLTLVGKLEDLSEIHKLQQAIGAEATRFERVAEATPGIVYVYDLIEHRNVYASRELGEALGYSPAEIAAMGCEFMATVIEPADQERVFAHHEALRRSPDGAVEELTYRARRADGTTCWLTSRDTPLTRLADGRVHQLVGVAIDVSGLKQAEERFRVIFEAAPVGMLVVDGDRIEFANPQLESMFGYEPDELLGQPPEVLVPLGLRPRHPDHRRGYLSGLVQPPDGRELQGLAKDGSEIPCELSLRLLQGSERVLAIVLDLREQKQASHERDMLQRQLQQVQRLEALGQLAGGVAHDFNNLTTAILSYAQLALDELGAEQQALRADLSEIKKAGERAARLTAQLLAFSRRQVLQPKVLDLAEVVREIEPLVSRLIGEHIQVRKQLAPPPTQIRADPGQLEQVVINLAVNARDAMPQGGQLEIRVRQEQLSEDVAAQHDLIEAGRYVVLEVADSGSGIEPDVLPHVFEPFFSTKTAGNGTGLGLATVYGIVKQSGGYVQLETEPGQGTEFRIYFEAVDAPVEDDSPSSTSLRNLIFRPGQRAQLVVLLVEDEPAVRRVVARVLEHGGYRVHEAQDAETGEEIFTAHQAEVDLLLTDVMLPGQNGRELAERIRARQPELPVLFMSGYTSGVLGEDGLIAPKTAFLSKPVLPRKLLQQVQVLLEDKLAARRPG